MTAPLLLAAEDAEDVAILSARLQDALTRLGDLAWLSRQRRFAARFDRFRWEANDDTRVQCVLTVDHVLSVRSQGLKLDAPDAVVSLLALRFEPGAGEENPGGTLSLVFAGGGTMALDVEYLDLSLKDVGDPWRARSRPDHEGPYSGEGRDGPPS